MAAAEVALGEKSALLAELKVLNEARNAVAHETYLGPRLDRVLPVFRLVLRDAAIRAELPHYEQCLQFLQLLPAWESSVLAAIGVLEVDVPAN